MSSATTLSVDFIALEQSVTKLRGRPKTTHINSPTPLSEGGVGAERGRSSVFGEIHTPESYRVRGSDPARRSGEPSSSLSTVTGRWPQLGEGSNLSLQSRSC